MSEFQLLVFPVIIILSLLTSGIQGGGDCTSNEEEWKLRTTLFTNYSRSRRPCCERGNSHVNISLNLVVSNLEYVDPKAEQISLQIWFRMTWYDYRLKWNVSQNNDLKSLTVEFEEIWTPDITLYTATGSVSDFGVSTEDGLKIGAIIYSDGLVFFSKPTTIRSSCNMNIADFPFDDQTCQLTFGSWSMDSTLLRVNFNNGGLDLRHFTRNSNWELLYISPEERMQMYRSHDNPFSVAIYTIAVRRRALFFAINYIIPPVVISVLSLLVFLIPPEVGKRMEAGINLLLCLSVYLLLVNSKMPNTSTAFPVLTKFYGCAIIILVVSMCCTCLVYAMYFMNSSGLEVQDASVAQCIKNFILKRREPLCFTSCRSSGGKLRTQRNQVIPTTADLDEKVNDDEEMQSAAVNKERDDDAPDSLIDEDHGNADTSRNFLPRITVVSPQDPGCCQTLTHRRSLDSSLSSFASFRSDETAISSNADYNIAQMVTKMEEKTSKSRRCSEPTVKSAGHKRSMLNRSSSRFFLYSETSQDSCLQEKGANVNTIHNTWCTDDSCESHGGSIALSELENPQETDKQVATMESLEIFARASEAERYKQMNIQQWKKAAKLLDQLFITVLLMSIVISFVTCLMLASRIRQIFIP